MFPRSRTLLAATVASTGLVAALAQPALAYTSSVALSPVTRVTTGGTALVVRGKVLAPSPHRTVSVQQLTGLGWKTLATAASTTTGAFAVRYISPTGRRTTRVLVAGVGSYPKVASAQWVVTAYKVGTYSPPTSVTLTGSRCMKVSPYAYQITYTFTAVGGYYVDLGSFGFATTVSNYGGVRHWYSSSTVHTWDGTPFAAAPGSSTWDYSERVAPLGQAGVMAANKVIETSFTDMHITPVSCPAP